MTTTSVPSKCPNWDRDTWIASDEYQSEVVDWLVSFAQLKGHHRIVDFGCGRGGISYRISKTLRSAQTLIAIDNCETLGQHGLGEDDVSICYSRCDGLSWMERAQDSSFDRIIMKQVIHCFSVPDQLRILHASHRVLAQGGLGIIMIMPPVAEMPLFRKAHEVFTKYNQDFREIDVTLKEVGFETQIEYFRYPVELSRSQWFQMLRERFMSSLQPISDDEIEQGIKELDQRYDAERYSFDDVLVGIRFRKK